jgi:hypothetical protein
MTMRTNEISQSLTTLFSELVDGAVTGGATIGAHAQHVRYDLSLMNRSAA